MFLDKLRNWETCISVQFQLSSMTANDGADVVVLDTRKLVGFLLLVLERSNVGV